MGPTGLHLQAYKPSACQTSRLKREPEVRNRDINGLVYGESLYLKQVLCVAHAAGRQAGQGGSPHYVG